MTVTDLLDQADNLLVDDAGHLLQHLDLQNACSQIDSKAFKQPG